MNRVLWTLIKINFKSMFALNYNSKAKSKKKKGIASKILLIILYVYVAVVFGMMFGFLFYSIGTLAISYNMRWFFFAMMFMLAFGISFIGSIFATQKQIYEVKDNELLLSMPIKPSKIVFGRVFTLIIMSLVYQSMVMIPAAVAYAILGGFDFASVLGFIAIYISVPLLTMSLSCIIGFVIAFITSRLKHKNIFTTVLSVAFFGLYFVFYMNINKYINELLTKGEEIAIAIKKGFYPAYAVGIAGEGNFLMMLAVLIVSGAIFSLVYAVISKSFVSIAKMSKSRNKIQYKAKELKTSSIKMAIMKNEFRHFGSNPMIVFNTEMGVFMSVIMTVMLFVRKSSLMQMAELNIATVEMICLAGAVFLVGMNFTSAVSINIEYKTLWLLKSLPLTAKDVFVPKVFTHFIMSESGVLIFAIATCIILPFDMLFTIMSFVLPTVMNIFIAISGILINIRKARFNWSNEIFAVKQSITGFLNMLVAISVTAVYVLMYLFVFERFVSISMYSLIFALILSALTFVLYRFLVSDKMQKRLIAFGEQ